MFSSSELCTSVEKIKFRCKQHIMTTTCQTMTLRDSSYTLATSLLVLMGKSNWLNVIIAGEYLIESNHRPWHSCLAGETGLLLTTVSVK